MVFDDIFKIVFFLDKTMDYNQYIDLIDKISFHEVSIKKIQINKTCQNFTKELIKEFLSFLKLPWKYLISVFSDKINDIPR